MAVDAADFCFMSTATQIDLLNCLFVTAGTRIERKLTTEGNRPWAMMIMTLSTICGLHLFVVGLMTFEA